MKRLRDRLLVVQRLPLRDRLILAQAWVLLIITDLALRVLPFKALLVGLRASRSAREIDESRLSPPLPRLIWLVEAAGRVVPVPVTCLKQAMVLSWLLARRGINTSIEIGVTTRDGTFKAHAWLERQGRAIFGLSGKESFRRLSPSPSRVSGS